jgi:hypothetical protein
MTPLLLELWRERHPEGIEQLGLDFAARQPLHPPRRLFDLKKHEPSQDDREVRADGH